MTTWLKWITLNKTSASKRYPLLLISRVRAHTSRSIIVKAEIIFLNLWTHVGAMYTYVQVVDILKNLNLYHIRCKMEKIAIDFIRYFFPSKVFILIAIYTIKFLCAHKEPWRILKPQFWTIEEINRINLMSNKQENEVVN